MKRFFHSSVTHSAPRRNRCGRLRDHHTARASYQDTIYSLTVVRHKLTNTNYFAENPAKLNKRERMQRNADPTPGPMAATRRLPEPKEGSFRVPAIIRWPGHVKPGSVSNGIMSGLTGFRPLSPPPGPNRHAHRPRAFKAPRGLVLCPDQAWGVADG